MRDRLKQADAENNRSMNAEIIHRLALTFEKDSYTTSKNTPPDITALDLCRALLRQLEIEQESDNNKHRKTLND